jgi:hypothetical protein
LPRPTDTVRAETEQAVARLIEITRTAQEAQQLLLDWLQTEFEIQEPGKRLAHVAELDFQTFVDEVHKRRPSTAKKLTPTALKALRDGYSEQMVPVQEGRVEAVVLERRVSDLVNAAYGLTEAECVLLWETAPPRMPLSS